MKLRLIVDIDYTTEEEPYLVRPWLAVNLIAMVDTAIRKGALTANTTARITKKDFWVETAVADTTYNTQDLGNHLIVERADGCDGITWDDLQAVKDETWGPDAWAIEVFPAASRLINHTNRRHLWRVEDEDLTRLNARLDIGHHV